MKPGCRQILPLGQIAPPGVLMYLCLYLKPLFFAFIVQTITHVELLGQNYCVPSSFDMHKKDYCSQKQLWGTCKSRMAL